MKSGRLMLCRNTRIALAAPGAFRALGKVASAATIAILAAVGAVPICVASERQPMHLAANSRGDYLGPASLGFNLADVSTVAALNALPKGVRAVYWLGNGYNSRCGWRVSDAEVARIVVALKGNRKFSGIYYISDEPHPRVCPDAAQRLSERTALIHSLDPSAKTFAIVLNGYTAPNEFSEIKDSVDYIGVDYYPCNHKNEAKGCSFDLLRAHIDRALDAGISTKRIVPVFQAFGQECTRPGWSDRQGGRRAPQQYYRLPSISETRSMLSIWDEKVPRAERPFDMVYSWGEQPALACPSLQRADGRLYPDLRSVYAEYFKRQQRPLSKAIEEIRR